MTCIVGIIDKENNNVVIGGDSAATSDSCVTIRKDEKVFKKGDFIIGCTTSFRMIQILRFSFTPPEITKDIYEYMCTDFIDSIRECFKKGGFSKKDNDDQELGGTFLVAYKDRLFEIDDDFQVGENLDAINAIGCGADFAYGALYSLSKQNIPTKDKVLNALEAAEYLSSGVRRPFVLMNT